MPGVGIALAFTGYLLTYYGITQVQGGNWGLFDLASPNRWKKPEVRATPRDSNFTLLEGPYANASAGQSGQGPKSQRTSDTIK